MALPKSTCFRQTRPAGHVLIGGNMIDGRLVDKLIELEGTQVTVYILGEQKVAGELTEVCLDHIVVEDKFFVPIASIGYVAKSRGVSGF